MSRLWPTNQLQIRRAESGEDGGTETTLNARLRLVVESLLCGSYAGKDGEMQYGVIIPRR